MDSMRILIAGLGAACLLVACLIVVVLRRPAPSRGRRPQLDEAEAQTLARIYAVHPAPSGPAPDEPAALPNLSASEPAPLGRMPELPDLRAMPGMPTFPQYADVRDRPLPAARIPAGPLPFERVSAQAEWDGVPDMPIGRPVSGELPLPVASNGGAEFGIRPTNSPGFLPGAQRGTNIGRMPGFEPAPSSPPVLPMTPSPAPQAAQERLADATEQRRLGALTRVYAEGILVAYDPACDAVDVAFSACPMRSPAEVALAFRVLLAKVRTVLKPLGRDRAALLLDVAGLEIGPDVAPAWMASLKAFLLAACEQAGPQRILVARYTTRSPSIGNQQEMLDRIQGASSEAARGLQNTVLSSREEAAALLARLRSVATVPSA